MKDKIEQALNEANINVIIVLVDSYTTLDTWECKRWKVTITSKQGKASFKYYTGMAVLAPCVASVIESLVKELESAYQTFDDWCRDFGFSNDSIKALKAYKGCVKTLRKMQRVFTNEQLVKLAHIVEEG